MNEDEELINVERFNPDPDYGLTTAQAEERIAQGFDNHVNALYPLGEHKAHKHRNAYDKSSRDDKGDRFDEAGPVDGVAV